MESLTHTSHIQNIPQPSTFLFSAPQSKFPPLHLAGLPLPLGLVFLYCMEDMNIWFLSIHTSSSLWALVFITDYQTCRICTQISLWSQAFQLFPWILTFQWKDRLCHSSSNEQSFFPHFRASLHVSTWRMSFTPLFTEFFWLTTPQSLVSPKISFSFPQRTLPWHIHLSVYATNPCNVIFSQNTHHGTDHIWQLFICDFFLIFLSGHVSLSVLFTALSQNLADVLVCSRFSINTYE